MESTINREAGDKTKGFRFQKLRACIRLLEKITANGKNRFSCAIELLEDSFLADENDVPTVSVEENKIYTSSLSFNSSPIRNTVVAFLDLSFRYVHDPSLSLCFFASATVGSERPSEELLSSASVDKSTPCSILKKLIEKSELSHEEIKICHRIVLNEYAKQYASKDGGFLSAIEKWTPEELVDFVKRIEWGITSDSNDELEDRALNHVKLCPFFTNRHEELEKFILTAILDKFERLSEQEHATLKLLHVSDIELIYTQVLGKRENTKPIDPAYKNWDAIKVVDMRNLSEKIEAVSPDYLPVQLRKLIRRCALAKFEAETFGKEYVSLRRRIFDVCEEVLDEKITGHTTFDRNVVDKILKEMADKSIAMMADIGKSYSYQINDQETIKGAILSLFDECYIAFDESL
jgi:hypothetical protein